MQSLRLQKKNLKNNVFLSFFENKEIPLINWINLIYIYIYIYIYIERERERERGIIIHNPRFVISKY